MGEKGGVLLFAPPPPPPGIKLILLFLKLGDRACKFFMAVLYWNVFF